MADKRWDLYARKNVANDKVDTFIEEILEVCKKHGLHISHEDTHGAFVITNDDESGDYYQRWLRASMVNLG